MLLMKEFTSGTSFWASFVVANNLIGFHLLPESLWNYRSNQEFQLLLVIIPALQYLSWPAFLAILTIIQFGEELRKYHSPCTSVTAQGGNKQIQWKPSQGQRTTLSKCTGLHQLRTAQQTIASVWITILRNRTCCNRSPKDMNGCLMSYVRRRQENLLHIMQLSSHLI